jgi:hypothetical protein
MKASIHASAPIDEATEKSRFSQPRDQGSCDNQDSKHTPANRSGRVERSFEPGSCVTDASDLHPEMQESQITSTDESTSNRSHEMQSDRTAILLCQNQMEQMQANCICKSSIHKSLQPMKGCESMSNRSTDMHGHRTAILLCLHQMIQMQAICIEKSSVYKSLHNKEQSRSDSPCNRHSKIYHKAAAFPEQS